MPEIARFYGIVIKMFLNPKSMSPVIFTLFTGNMSANSISLLAK